MNVKLINATTDGEKLIAYCARVSSPNQENEEIEGLLRYCWNHKHWSIFEQADMTVEITTSRAISQQIVRHRSFTFQEFSQRYAKVFEYETVNPRRQDTKNRQNSIDDLPEDVKEIFKNRLQAIQRVSQLYYNELLELGVSKESARFLLPICAKTVLYMKGNVRSWIHYLQTRTDPSTQLEHREIAEAIKTIFIGEFPIIGKLIER